MKKIKGFKYIVMKETRLWMVSMPYIIDAVSCNCTFKPYIMLLTNIFKKYCQVKKISVVFL